MHDDESASMEYVVYELNSNEAGQSWRAIPPSPRFSYDKDGKVKKLKGSAQLVKSIALDAEGRIISSIDEDLGIDALAYQVEDEYIPYPVLPYKGHDAAGRSFDDENRKLEPFQGSGGGFINGQEDRYIPIYRY